MPWYFWILLVIYFGVCIFLVLVILLQAGKGGGLSSLMGGGGGLADQLGATSAERTLSKMTTYCAIAFGFLAIALAIIGARHAHDDSILEQIERRQQQQVEQTVDAEAAPEPVDDLPAANTETTQPVE